MTAITQKIPRFIGGISDQPDEQKLPGQLRDGVNCIPDVVQGLIKRPGLNLLNELDTHSEGRWFFIDKSNNFNTGDRYVGQIDNITGKVKCWSLDSGKAMDICYTDVVDPLDVNPSVAGIRLPDTAYTRAYSCVGEADEEESMQFKEYFKATNIDDLQVLTINDYTFVCNRKNPVEMGEVEADKRLPEAFIELRSIAGLTDYKLEFKEPIPNIEDIPDTSALSLSVQSVGLVTDRDPDGTASCPGIGTVSYSDQTPDDEEGRGTGLGFTITTTAVVVPDQVTSPVVRPPIPENANQFQDPFQQNPVTQQTIQQDCVYATSISLTNKGVGWRVGDTVTKVLGSVVYVVKVETVGKNIPTGTLGAVEYTSPRENPKVDVILNDLVADINALGVGFEARRIGNGIYVKRDPLVTEDEDGEEVSTPRPFSVTSTNTIVLRALSSTTINEEEDSFIIQANDISELPLQAVHNLPFFIRNSFSEADDYYVQFKGNNANDGPGTYVEIAKPGIPHTFEPSSMPHGLLRLSRTRKDEDGDTIVTFLVTSFKWAAREAGDDLTNPRPSFAPEDDSIIGRAINNLAFYRNRFVVLTDENVVASVAGDFFNFWSKTAQRVSPGDPIDLQVSSNFPAELFAAQATTSGLVLFSENAQFLFGTENDVLQPSTARTSLLSTYNFNRNSNTVNLGTTVGFVSGIGRYTRFYEMSGISRDQEPEVIEQSKVIERLIPGDYYELGCSKDNQTVMFGKRYFNEVWMFRYFNTGERRAQSAWTRWKFDGNLVSHACINDSYFAVITKDDRTFLLRGDWRSLQSTVMLDDTSNEDYRTFLDYAIAVEKGTAVKPGYQEIFKKNSKGESRLVKITFNPEDVGLPIFADNLDNLYSVVFDPTTEQGYIVPARYKNGTVSIATTVPNQKIFVGYLYRMNVVLPQFYIKKQQQQTSESWDTANVIIQRVKLNLGRVGAFTTTLKRSGRPDYTQYYEAKPMDMYDANNLGYLADYEQTTPVYQRNTTFLMSLTSNHPSPCTLYSATWEGQYQENYVKRL